MSGHFHALLDYYRNPTRVSRLTVRSVFVQLTFRTPRTMKSKKGDFLHAGPVDGLTYGARCAVITQCTVLTDARFSASKPCQSKS